MFKKLLILLILIVSAGCNVTLNTITPTASPTESPTQTLTNTPTLVLSPSKTPTATLTPTATKNPTATPTINPNLVLDTIVGFGKNAYDSSKDYKTVWITNTNNDGTGSLRWCANLSYPRICRFAIPSDTSSYIPFVIFTTSQIVVTNPYLVLDGHDQLVIVKNAKPTRNSVLMVSNTHHIFIQYMRFRAGDNGETNTCCIDSVSIVGSNNIAVSHSSVTWAVDGNFDISRSHTITVQYSIIAEGLDRAGHEKGGHSTGLLVDEAVSDRVTIAYNLFASNRTRNPRIKGGKTLVEFYYNTIYNYNSVPGVVSEESNNLRLNYVGNFGLAGPDSITGQYLLAILNRSDSYDVTVYATRNYIAGVPDTCSGCAVRTGDRQYLVEQPFPGGESFPVMSAQEGHTIVLAQSGATLPMRDATDTRIINGVITQTGRIISVVPEKY